MNVWGFELDLKFCSYLAAVLLIAALLLALRRMPRFFSLLSLPGTMGHELLHYLVGAVTLAKPVKASLIPKFHRDGSTTLGYVMFANIRWYNALFVGLAPLFALPASFWLVHYRAAQIPPLSWWELGWGYLAASLACSCLPSKADIDIVLSRPVGLVVYLAGAAAAWWGWGRIFA